jgi:hypothetical protein
MMRKFEDSIREVSPTFCSIYNESFRAEQLGLMQICGVGYRKSLEFLIKDYLKKKHPGKVAEIENKFLGRCIKEDIADANVKAVAERATWLGNDETHYVRKWVDKDLTDLKKLIDLTLHWMAAEELTADTLASMPDGKS